MVDLALLYSIAESSGALVAIVAAFFTTKILTIASESRTIRNQIDLIQAEIDGRREVAGHLEKQIDTIETDWAKEYVEDFYRELRDEYDTGTTPPLEEVLEKFNQSEGELPNDYEEKFLREMYDGFLQKLGEEPEADGTYISPTEVLGKSERVKGWSKELEELNKNLFAERITISILGHRKQEYEEQLKALSFPKYTRFGFLSFAYFAVVGVIVPLAAAAWAPNLNSCVVGVIFFLFLSGLGGMFSYLLLEIRDALRKKPEPAATRTEQAER